MEKEENALPRWNLDSLYSGFDDPAYRQDIKNVETATGKLRTMVEDTRKASTEGEMWIAGCIDVLNDASEKLENLESYTACRYTTATTDREAVRRMNRIEELEVPLWAARAGFREILDRMDIPVDEICREGSALETYRFFLLEELEYRKFQMTTAEENLAADLARPGAVAWSRLQETISSTESVTWDEKTGERKTIVELRALAYDADRAIREKAYKAELAAWKRVELPMAYALNGVKGFSVIINSRRGHETTLDRSAMQNRISTKALEAMTGVMKESLPMFRDYLKAKAGILGVEKTAFFDLFAPVGESESRWDFPTTRDFILEQFHTFSDEYGAFGEKAFREGWIDAEPREGKVGGAYCTSFSSPWESRVLCNFDRSFNSVTTIAHELGHAYHHHVMEGNRFLTRDYPMTLAETASIFSENIVYGTLLSELKKEEKVPVLEAFLQDSCQVIVDILSRFLFESAVFEKRRDGELSPEEFCALMTDAQKQTYGDGLDPDLLHPYMWAVKGHYYSYDLAFYNFPYAFGLLFGLGLYGRYMEEGPAFTGRYRAILENTGKASAVDVARGAGFDIEQPDFWRTGIAVIADRVHEFRGAAGQ